MKFIDVPKFRVSPKPERFLIDKILVLIVLGILLYVGIYVNYFLLNQTIPQFLNILFIIVIFITLTIDALLCYMSYAHYVYDFYDVRLLINDGHISELKYIDITKMSYSANVIDKWLQTGSITLSVNNSKDIKLKYLANSNQLYFWLQKVTKPSQ